MRPALLLAIAVVAASAGCAQRRITVTSEPPGAVVWLNDTEIGRTPVDATFVYYGLYDVRLRKEGYEPIATSRDTGMPWYEYPPFDLVAEAGPWAVTTRKRWHFDLVRAPDEPALSGEEAILGRAAELRSQIEDGPPPPAP